MNYTVKFKLPGAWFWKTYKNVKGDFVATDLPSRVFLLDDESRVEIPFGSLVVFSKERYMVVLKQMEKESGQSIKTAGK